MGGLSKITGALSAEGVISLAIEGTSSNPTFIPGRWGSGCRRNKELTLHCRKGTGYREQATCPKVIGGTDRERIS